MKISDFCYVSDYVANGSFESLRNNVNYLDDGYAVLVRLTDFTKKWQSDFRYVSEDAYKFLKHSKLYAGDLIMANVGDPGIVFIVPDLKKPMTLGPNSILIRPTSSVAYTKFLYWYFKSKLGCDQITSITSATAQKKFNKTSFRALDIKLPPIAEQQRIAALLDTADRILKLRESAIEKLDQLAQSVFVEMFQKHIKKLKLKDTCSFVSGGTPSKDEPKFWGGDVAWISSADIEGDHVKEIRHFVTESAINNSATNPILPNNILVVTRTGVGKVVVTDRKFCFSQDITGLVLQKEFMPEFIAASIRNKQDEIVKQARGATIKGVTRDVIANVEIPAASFLEQQEFSEIIKTIDLQKKNFEIDRIKINDLLSSLQHQSFAVN